MTIRSETEFGNERVNTKRHAGEKHSRSNADHNRPEKPAAIALECLLSQADSQSYFFRRSCLSCHHMIDDLAHFFRILSEQRCDHFGVRKCLLHLRGGGPAPSTRT